MIRQEKTEVFEISKKHETTGPAVISRGKYYGYSISFNVLSASSFMRAEILLDDE